MLRQLQRRVYEPLGVAQRWVGRDLETIDALDETRRAPPERCERAEEPRVAEERRLLPLLRREKRLDRCPRAAAGDRLERLPLRSREAVARRRQLLQQPLDRGAEERQLRCPTARELRQP